MTLEAIFFHCPCACSSKSRSWLHSIDESLISTQRRDTLWAARGSPANCWQESSKTGRNLCSTNFTLFLLKTKSEACDRLFQRLSPILKSFITSQTKCCWLEETVRLRSWDSCNARVFAKEQITAEYSCFYMVRAQTNCTTSAGWPKSGPKFVMVMISWSLLPSAVIIMLAIYWEFLAKFININVCFYKMYCWV